MVKISTSTYNDLADDFAMPGKNSVLSLYWLGQAGFAIRWKNWRLLIDPYLSNYLAKKYRDHEFSHQRLMPPPVRLEQFKEVHFVLCTHSHSDHMDPETLCPLAEHNPQCRFIVPRAELIEANRRGIAAEQVIGTNAGERIELSDEITIAAIPSAHEELKLNERGEYYCLGYLLHFGNICVYHSGDCVPYAGLEKLLWRPLVGDFSPPQAPHLALLPINGRDAYRTAHNVLGNFTLQEAVSLCKNTGIPNLVGHHFGLFDFNTVDVDEVKSQISQLPPGVRVWLPEIGRRIDCTLETQSATTEEVF